MKRQAFLSILLLFIFVITTSGFTVSKMTCRKSGNVSYSLQPVKSCCCKKSSGYSCCHISETVLDVDHFVKNEADAAPEQLIVNIPIGLPAFLLSLAETAVGFPSPAEGPPLQHHSSYSILYSCRI